MTSTTRVSEEPEHIKRFRAFKLYYDKGQAYATDECKDGMKLLEDYDATSALLAECDKHIGKCLAACNAISCELCSEARSLRSRINAIGEI